MFSSTRFFSEKQPDLAATSFVVELIKKVKKEEPIEAFIKKQTQAILNDAIQLIINYLSRLEEVLDTVFINIRKLYPLSNDVKVMELILVLVNKQVDLQAIQIEKENPALYKLIQAARAHDLIVDEFIAIGNAIHKERTLARASLAVINP